MGPILDAQLRVWDAKNFGLVSPGTHRNKFVKKSLTLLTRGLAYNGRIRMLPYQFKNKWIENLRNRKKTKNYLFI